MALKLYIKQAEQFFQGTLIHYEGINPQSLHKINGPLPAGSRRWLSWGAYEDVTKSVSDLQKQLKLTWTTNYGKNGQPTPGTINQKKSVSGTITFEGAAYQLLRSWLVLDVSNPLNSVDVQIVDTNCGRYLNYSIKPSDLQWCEGDVCLFNVALKQKDEDLNCIKRTLITDNWQGWFQVRPENGKKHPRFSYCNEIRPNGMLIMDWFNAASNGLVTYLFIFSLLPIINTILFILQLIQDVLNAIPGVDVDWNIPAPISATDLLNNYQQYYVESAGCGREHPAPLIRDYITNVCDKCGILVDEESAPIYFAQTMDVETSGGIESVTNHHYNACFFNAPVKRGIRRFKSLSVFNSTDANDTDFWVPDNAPLLTLDMFLDKLDTLYNSEWRVRNGRLFIQRKDFWKYDNYIYDFTTNSPDREKILEGVCYEPNELKYPAYCVGIYSPDPADSCGNEAGNTNGGGQMNGIVSFGNVEDNPNYEGVLDKSVDFGATRFRLDGVTNDYIYDAMQVIVNGAIFTPFLPGLFRDFISPAIRKYADYALLLSSETAVLPKVIIWSGDDYLNARAIALKAAWPGTAPQPMPENNIDYNKDPQDWNVRHTPDTKVIGENLTLPASPEGIYRVTDYFGIVITEQPAILINYPMYFEPFYKGTLWDWFHWIDDPAHNPVMNLNWRVKIDLCCEDLQKIKCMDDAQDIVLGQKVKLPFGYYQDGVIREITVSYDTSDVYGQYIELKGTL